MEAICDVIWENPAYGGPKNKALIKRRAFCALSLALLSYMNICSKHFTCVLHNLKTIYEYKHNFMERLI